MSYSLISGSAGIAGSPTPFQSDGNDGNDSSLTINGYQFTAYGGGAGIGSQNTGYGGNYDKPSGLAINLSYYGMGANGLQYNFALTPTGFFDSSFDGYGCGRVSGGAGATDGIAKMVFHY